MKMEKDLYYLCEYIPEYLSFKSLISSAKQGAVEEIEAAEELEVVCLTDIVTG